MNYPHNSISVSIVEGKSYTPASIQINVNVHLESGIIASSGIFLSREETEALIHELKDKLGALRYAKQVA